MNTSRSSSEDHSHFSRTQASAMRLCGVTLASLMAVSLASPSIATAASSDEPEEDNTQQVQVEAGQTATITPPSGRQIIATTSVEHGSADIDGNHILFTPDEGFFGQAKVTYTTTDSASLYSTNVPALGSFDGVDITGGAYGSAVVTDPNDPTIVYGLTDRGPNVDGPEGVKVEPLPDFAPSIGKFKIDASTGKASLLEGITLKGTDGEPMNGQVDPNADTHETIVDLEGNVLDPSDHGFDSEGLVLAADGTFWVSDEYGPFIVHFDANGKEIARLSPYDGTLPKELRYRMVNRGMEGLTITPDGTTLVGSMQSALNIDDDKQTKPKNIPFIRIVTYNLSTHELHEYATVLDDPVANGTAVSEIAAVPGSNTKFLIDERDGDFQPGAYKKIYEIDLANATDIGPLANVTGGTYSDDTGLNVDVSGTDTPLEELFTDVSQSTQGEAILQAHGITPTSKELYLDFGQFTEDLNTNGYFFGHDKVEGIYMLDSSHLLVSNDSDFGIDGLSDSEGNISTDVEVPYKLHPKILPNGSQDDGAYLIVDVDKAHAVLSGNDAPQTQVAEITVTPSAQPRADSLAVRRGNTYYFKNSISCGEADRVIAYGKPGDQVLVGDWDGDGKDTLAVRRGSTYHFKNSLNGGEADKVIAYGKPGDQVLVGDWGNDVDTLAVRRGSTYYFKNSINGGQADKVIAYGKSSDNVLVGDWNGSGVDTLAVRRGKTYHFKYSISGGKADKVIAYGNSSDQVLAGRWQ